MIRRFLLRLLRADEPRAVPCHECAAERAAKEAAIAAKDETIATLKAEINFGRGLVRSLHAKLGAPVNDGGPRPPLERDRTARRPPWTSMNVGGGHLSPEARTRAAHELRPPGSVSPAGHDSGVVVE